MVGTIHEKVSALDSVRRELRALRPSSGDGDEYRLFPPPAPGEVRAHERRAGRSFPPSFRAFLELANGWRGFMRGWTLLGLRRRETELFFREGLDERLLGALKDLVPEAELRTLTTREKTDPKVLSPGDHQVVAVDGRGSALVLDERRATAGEPEIALVKYVWVQRRWASFEAMLDDALKDASQELDKIKAAALPPLPKKKSARGAKSEKKTANPKKLRGPKPPAVPKLRIVEIRPSKKTKAKPAAKKSQKK
jgi:hypothetical protein